MARARINCPNCKQPILADLQQIFDTNEDPSAKARFLSGLVNFVQCPYCGYQGNVATAIVYHDPEKELLLTYVPAELGLPHAEQEKMLGALINQIITHLTPEQRKGYLLRPQAHLTVQSMVERVLESDGITKEMIQAQQQRLNLLQKLSSVSDENSRLEILKQEEKLVDADMLTLLNRLIETAVASGDRDSAKALQEIQNLLIENTEFGQEVKRQNDEVQAAITSLQNAGKDLTREKLLELVINAPSEIRLTALVSIARPGMDYTFFQLLSERIDRSSGNERERLIELRSRLLEMTREIDAQMEARLLQSRQLLNNVLKAEDVEKATEEVLPEIDNFFLQAVEQELEASRKIGDLEKISKLQKVNAMIEKASEPPPEVQLIQDLLDAPDEASRQQILENNSQMITEDFISALSNLNAQAQESNQDPQLVTRLKSINRQVLRFSMQANLRGG